MEIAVSTLSFPSNLDFAGQPVYLGMTEKDIQMKKGFITASIVLIVMSIYIVIESSQLERTMKMGVGVGFLPFWMGVIIGTLALALLIFVLRGKIAFEDKPLFVKESLSRVVPLVTAMILYLIFIEIIGYTISSFLFLFATMLLLRRSGIINILISAAVFTAFLYAIFKLWLKSPLPTGFLGI